MASKSSIAIWAAINLTMIQLGLMITHTEYGRYGNPFSNKYQTFHKKLRQT